jgi:hypothetical protein
VPPELLLLPPELLPPELLPPELLPPELLPLLPGSGSAIEPELDVMPPLVMVLDPSGPLDDAQPSAPHHSKREKQVDRWLRGLGIGMMSFASIKS